MKLIDEKLAEEAAKQHSENYCDSLAPHMTLSHKSLEIAHKVGVNFAEQQLKQKMIEFGKYCLMNYPKNTTVDYKTTEQLLEEFLNQQE